MIGMLVNQLLGPKEIKKSADSLLEALKQYPLQEGELLPLMVLVPEDSKLFLKVIVLKQTPNGVEYSRQIKAEELTAEMLVKMLAGK